MSLNCIIGEAIFDKGKYIYNKAVKLENNDISPIIFVPSQARMSSEEEYILKTKKNGILTTYITTLSRYISKLIDNDYKKNREYITDDVKRMYIKQIIDENIDNLSLFKNIAYKPTFIDLIISYIDSIKKEEIDINKLQELNISSNLTKVKLLEIVNICNIVNNKISEKYIDSLDMLEMFNEYILENKEEFKNKEIFFHGYNNFSKKELNIIKGFLNIGLNVNVSLTLPYDVIISDTYTDSIFEIPYKTYRDLKNISSECGVHFNIIKDLDKLELKEDIEFLVNNIFSSKKAVYDKKSSNVTLKLEKNLNYEIENIARDITKKTRMNEDIRYRDFAIYTNSFEEYEFCIKRIFNEYNIAYHFDDTSEVEFSNLAIYILTLLKIANDGMDTNKLLVLLKTDLFNISKEDLNYFENYVLEFGIKGYMLNKEFKKNNREDQIENTIYNLEKLNEIRENINGYINKFIESIKKEKKANGKIKTIYNHLIEEEIIKKYGEKIDITKGEDIKEGDIKRQVIDVIYEIFDNISLVTQDSDISLDTFITLFEFGMKDRKIITIPMTIDAVEICDINKTRILPKKYVYIIGANEEGLPNFSTEDVMFSDKELSELKEKNIEIKQNSLSRTNMALFNVYIALANAKDNVIVTMPASKITGEPLRVGVLINEIKRILSIKLEGNISREDKYDFKEDEMTKLAIFKRLLVNITKLDDIDENKLEYLYNLYLYFIKSEEKYKDILEYTRKDDNLSKEVLDKLYKDKINSSVSRLETFKKCPFSYYTNYILNIKPRKKYSLSVMDIGTLMHDVLEKFSKWVMERSLLWQQVINDEDISNKAKDKIDEIVDKIFEDKYNKYKDNNRYIVLKSQLKRNMFKIIKIIATSFNQSEFKPLGYEIEFKDGALYSPIEINLDSGKTMYLIGKIDRVDTACINDKIYVRIIDYKSSSKNISLKDIKEGISLQLMSYMSALINNKENIANDKDVLPAAINYFSLKTNIKRLDEFEQDEDKIKKELIKAMKLKGIYLSDINVIEGMDRKYKDTGNSFIDINSRNIKDENKVLTLEKFNEECVNIQNILKEIGKEITKGVVKINPKKYNGRLPCEYCDYISVCRKNIRG